MKLIQVIVLTFTICIDFFICCAENQFTLDEYSGRYYSIHSDGGYMCNYAIGDDYIYRVLFSGNVYNYFGPGEYLLYRRNARDIDDEMLICNDVKITWPILAYTEDGLYLFDSVPRQAYYEDSDDFVNCSYAFSVYYLEHSSMSLEQMYISLPDRELRDCIYYNENFFFITNCSIIKYTAKYPMQEQTILTSITDIFSDAYHDRTYVDSDYLYLIADNSIIQIDTKSGEIHVVYNYTDVNYFTDTYECAYSHIVLGSKVYLWDYEIGRMVSVDISSGAREIISEKLYYFRQVTKYGVLTVETELLPEPCELTNSRNEYQAMYYYYFCDIENPVFYPDNMKKIRLPYNAIIINSEMYMSVVEAEIDDFIYIEDYPSWYVGLIQ